MKCTTLTKYVYIYMNIKYAIQFTCNKTGTRAPRFVIGDEGGEGAPGLVPQ